MHILFVKNSDIQRNGDGVNLMSPFPKLWRVESHYAMTSMIMSHDLFDRLIVLMLIVKRVPHSGANKKPVLSRALASLRAIFSSKNLEGFVVGCFSVSEVVRS